MSKNWLKEHRQDSYYRKAKQEGYRSRAAFKLYQINKKFRLMRKGNKVIDLGAAPGGWSQVAVEIVGDEGRVVGIDLDSIRPMQGAEFIRGDMLAVDAMDKIKLNKPDLMTLDMVMPRQSGIRLMRKLRKNEEWAHIPIIVITAHAQDEFGSEEIKKFEAFAARHRPK